MKFQFIGVGNAFCHKNLWQSNIMVHSRKGGKLMLDFGADVRHALEESGGLLTRQAFLEVEKAVHELREKPPVLSKSFLESSISQFSDAVQQAHEAELKKEDLENALSNPMSEISKNLISKAGRLKAPTKKCFTEWLRRLSKMVDKQYFTREIFLNKMKADLEIPEVIEDWHTEEFVNIVMQAVRGYNFFDVDAIFISHLHNDHVGGMEGIALTRYYTPDVSPAKLYCVDTLMTKLWNWCLLGGLKTQQGEELHIQDFFECKKLEVNKSFKWEGIKFSPVQTVHVMNKHQLMENYGLIIEDLKTKKTVFFTADCQFSPERFMVDFYRDVDLVLHDAETLPYESGVHAHYKKLRTLDEEHKEKMVLYHYSSHHVDFDAKGDGFLGFAGKGQIISVENSDIVVDWKG